MSDCSSDEKPQVMLSSYYGDAFYQTQMERSYRSAQKYASFLFSFFRPNSVADLGCGRGTWLKAFRDEGVENVVGYDGPWNSQDKMIDQEIRFRPIDLNRSLDFVGSERYDLAISLEVAEHLEKSSAKNFVKTLTNLSDIVMFSAAFNGQGGMNHINEQPHTYWASLFRENGYAPYDVFRPMFWGDEEVDYWYQQNTFLYVKNSCWLVQVLADIGYVQVQNVRFMNCVHPALYKEKIAQASPAAVFRRMAVSAIPRPLLPPLRWIKKSLLA